MSHYQPPELRITGTGTWWKHSHTLDDQTTLPRLHYVKICYGHVSGYSMLGFPQKCYFLPITPISVGGFYYYYFFISFDTCSKFLNVLAHLYLTYLSQACAQDSIKIRYFWDTLDLLLKVWIITVHLYSKSETSWKHWMPYCACRDRLCCVNVTKGLVHVQEVWHSKTKSNLPH